MENSIDYDAVVFDMDGVIFDSERAVMQCWKELATIEGTRAPGEICHKVWDILTVKNSYKSIKVDAYSSDGQDSNNSITIIVCA